MRCEEKGELRLVQTRSLQEATHQGVLASSISEVNVGVDPVECIGSQGTSSSSSVVGGVGIATPYGRALSGHIVGVGSLSFRSLQGHRARIEDSLMPPSGRRPGEQLTIKEGLGAQWQSNLDMLWVRCFFARGWTFNG